MTYISGVLRGILQRNPVIIGTIRKKLEKQDREVVRETAERRMFSKKVIDNDNFLSLSSSAQALYLHLSMSADDDGFCSQVSICMFKAHASTQDLEALIEKKFIYQFENGVIVISHWRMSNLLRKDRYTATIHTKEFEQIQVEKNGIYSFKDGCQVVANNGLPSGCQVVAERLPQDSIGKVSLGKDSLGEVSVGKDSVNTSVEPPEPKERIRYQEIADMYNSICVSLPKLKTLSDGRKEAVKRIVDKFGMDRLKQCFEMAEESDFVSGRDGKWGNASFDWLIKPANFVKVIDGNYANRTKRTPSPDNNFRLPGGQIDWDAFDEWANEVDREIEERRKQSDS